MGPALPGDDAADMLAHISMRGDVPGRAGTWLGEPGSRLPVEALVLARAQAGPPHLAPSVETQIIYGLGLKTPWTPAGRPCGSAGLALGALGIRFRLSPETAPFFDCRYDIAFTDGTRQEDVAGADLALSPGGGEVEAIRLHVRERPAIPVLVLDDLDHEAPPGADDFEDDPAIRLRLLSPAFGTRAPDIRHASTIPAGPWHAMAFSFNRRVFGGRPATLRLLDEAIVSGEGIVFDRALRLVPGTDRLMPEGWVEQHRALAQTARDGGIRRIAGLGVLVKARAPNNFGHFLMDMFPKAWLTARLLTRRPTTCIVHGTDILPVVEEALGRIGIPTSAISVTDGQPVLCEQLIVIDGLTAHGVYQSPLSVQALMDLGAGIPAAPYAKLFVTRHARERPLLNQDAVAAALRERGFVVVDPARMTLAEQISLFKGATTVVGPLGAALTNIAFCPIGARIVAITSQSFPDTFFWFLSQHRGHDYREIRCLDASGTPEAPQSWEAGFTMSEEDIASLATL
ncbi:MAG: glycosyltransferase family 61 protein [Proteobacteria bacterium]|nr:glycosyltransferase family 61 protein [Pseudomonadota bacterium]